jgi:hypothetical protein
MEWMDPMSWRLPSGKALAEFALQSGFLAPLMLGGPRIKRKKPVARVAVTGKVPTVMTRSGSEAVTPAVLDERLRKEEPGVSGTFPQSGFHETGFRESGFRETR